MNFAAGEGSLVDSWYAHFFASSKCPAEIRFDRFTKKKKKLKWSTVNSHLHDPVLRIFTENLYEKAPRRLTKEMIWHICLSECQIRDDG